MKKNKIGQCYLCGAVGEMTKEHVPPKFLAPELPDSEFAIVSVCLKCNNGNSHEESKFRDFLVTAAYDPNNKDIEGAYKAMVRNYTRNPVAQKIFGKPNKDMLRVWSGMKKIDVYTPAGIYLGRFPVIQPARDVQWREILIKTAKGLHYLFTGEIVSADYIAMPYFIDKIDNPEVFESLPIRKRAGNFFHFRGGNSPDDPKAGVWYMTFYKKVSAVVWFFPPSFKNRRPQGGSNEKSIS